jgi:hypothetical protein
VLVNGPANLGRGRPVVNVLRKRGTGSMYPSAMPVRSGSRRDCERLGADRVVLPPRCRGTRFASTSQRDPAAWRLPPLRRIAGSAVGSPLFSYSYGPKKARACRDLTACEAMAGPFERLRPQTGRSDRDLVATRWRWMRRYPCEKSGSLRVPIFGSRLQSEKADPFMS